MLLLDTTEDRHMRICRKCRRAGFGLRACCGPDSVQNVQREDVPARLFGLVEETVDRDTEDPALTVRAIASQFPHLRPWKWVGAALAEDLNCEPAETY